MLLWCFRSIKTNEWLFSYLFNTYVLAKFNGIKQIMVTFSCTWGCKWTCNNLTLTRPIKFAHPGPLETSSPDQFPNQNLTYSYKQLLPEAVVSTCWDGRWRTRRARTRPPSTGRCTSPMAPSHSPVRLWKGFEKPLDVVNETFFNCET